MRSTTLLEKTEIEMGVEYVLYQGDLVFSVHSDLQTEDRICGLSCSCVRQTLLLKEPAIDHQNKRTFWKILKIF